MALNMLTKRNWLLNGIVVALLAGALIFFGCTEYTKPEPTPTPTPISTPTSTPKVGVLGEAQIVVYAKGEKIVLDSKSPYFTELQLACEEMFELREHIGESTAYEGWTAFPDSLPEISKDLPAIDHPIAVELRNNEYAIELIYAQTQYVYLGGVERPTAFSHLLIPLTGKLAHQSYKGTTYLHLIPLLSSQEYQNYYRSVTGGIGTTRDGQEVRKILRRFGIEVPD